jgi:hypothetical protein
MRERERDRAVVGPAESDALGAMTEDLAPHQTREERLAQKEVVEALGLYKGGGERLARQETGIGLTLGGRWRFDMRWSGDWLCSAHSGTATRAFWSPKGRRVG